MSAENNKVCCNCGHCIRDKDKDGFVIRCFCEIDNTILGYIQVMTGRCRRWAKKKEDSDVDVEPR